MPKQVENVAADDALTTIYRITHDEGEEAIAARLAERLSLAGTEFVIEPHVRFKGEVGEQATMFFIDPSGNALEFKAFADDSQLFAK